MEEGYDTYCIDPGAWCSPLGMYTGSLRKLEAAQRMLHAIMSARGPVGAN